MRFLVDAALSPIVAQLLGREGHDATHVYEFGMHSASDVEIMDRADGEGRILISADTDFGTLLAFSGKKTPSVILLRGNLPNTPSQQARLLLNNLTRVQEALEEGSLVIFEPSRLRIRRLPIIEGP